MNLYQKQPVTLDDILPTLQLPPADQMPHLILSVSPCRSGTTVMLRVLGAMGAQAHFQPLKNLLRWQMQAQPFRWALPATNNGQPVYLKETLGPYTMAEATFNPLELLLRAGVPASHIHLWLYTRAPLDSFASWSRWWGSKTDVAYFIASYQTLVQIEAQAAQLAIPTTTLTYEIFATQPIPLVISRLAEQLGLPFSPSAVAGWEALPPFGMPASNIYLPEEPTLFKTPGIHDAIHGADAFAYFPTTPAMSSALTAEAREAIIAAELLPLYARWEAACLRDLGLG
jgi:hypothetical protein